MFIHFLDFIDEDYIPLVISRGIITEKSDIRPINNASEKNQGAFSKDMSILYTFNNEDYIPLVIKTGIIPEKSENVPLPKEKKSTRKVGGPKKSTVDIKPT